MLAFLLPDHRGATPGAGVPWRDHPSWELVDVASEATGVDVASLLLTAGGRGLDVEEHAHLSTFVLSIMGVDAAERLGLSPMATAGYGLGEYAALVASGSISFEDGARLVLERSAAVRRCIGAAPCAVATVLGLDDVEVEAACARAEGGAWVVGYDAPGRVVVAGTPEGVSRASQFAVAMGAIDAAVHPGAQGPSHTPLVDAARDRLRKSLATVEFSTPDPVCHANVDARAHVDPAEWAGLLSAQLCAPVRWRQCAVSMFDAGVRTFVAFGGDDDLAAMTRSSCPSGAVQAHAIDGPDGLEALLDRLIATPSLRRTPAVDHAQLSSRLVVAAGAGPFRPSDDVAHAAPRLTAAREPGEVADQMIVEVGDLLGWVGDDEVRSPFRGMLGGLLVIEGERVMPSQPVAWLRVHAA